MLNIKQLITKKTIIKIIIFLVILIICVKYSSLEPKLTKSNHKIMKNFDIIKTKQIQYIEDNYYDIPIELNDVEIIFLTRYSGFSCSICLNEYVNISNQLVKMSFPEKKIAYLFQRDERSPIIQKRFIERWMKINDIDYGMKLVNKNLKFDKTCIILKDSTYYKQYFFPLGYKRLDEVFNDLNRLSERKNTR